MYQLRYYSHEESKYVTFKNRTHKEAIRKTERTLLSAATNITQQKPHVFHLPDIL